MIILTTYVLSNILQNTTRYDIHGVMLTCKVENKRYKFFVNTQPI